MCEFFVRFCMLLVDSLVGEPPRVSREVLTVLSLVVPFLDFLLTRTSLVNCCPGRLCSHCVRQESLPLYRHNTARSPVPFRSSSPSLCLSPVPRVPRQLSRLLVSEVDVSYPSAPPKTVLLMFVRRVIESRRTL